jgi:hypothetical protein
MFGSDDDDIVVTERGGPSGDRRVRNVQWLSIHLAVYQEIEQETERTRIDVARRQDDLVRIPTRARVIIVVGQNVSCDRIYRDREKEKDESGKRRHAGTGDPVRSLADAGCEFHRKNCVSAVEYGSDGVLEYWSVGVLGLPWCRCY